MVLRMYERWAADRGYQVELIEASPAKAGLKSATATVKGENAYGVLKAERGVHRLVRLSPFDAAHRRHTAFAQVVAPTSAGGRGGRDRRVGSRVDTYRASGAGGQHVNKTDEPFGSPTCRRGSSFSARTSARRRPASRRRAASSALRLARLQEKRSARRR